MPELIQEERIVTVEPVEAQGVRRRPADVLAWAALALARAMIAADGCVGVECEARHAACAAAAAASMARARGDTILTAIVDGGRVAVSHCSRVSCRSIAFTVGEAAAAARDYKAMRRIVAAILRMLRERKDYDKRRARAAIGLYIVNPLALLEAAVDAMRSCPCAASIADRIRLPR